MAWLVYPGKHAESPAVAYTMLTLTAFFLACNHIIGRAVHGEIPPVGLSFWRWVAGALILLPFALPGLRRQWPLLRNHLGAVCLLGAFMVGSTTLVLVALTRTYAINVSLINAVQPTLTVFFAWLLFREPLSGWRSLGVVCGISGVVVMVTRADLSVLAGMDLLAGDFIALLAMCGFAGYALNLRRLPREIGVVVALLAITVSGTLMLTPFYLWETLSVGVVPVTATSIAAILALALLVTVLGNLCWYTGNRLIGPSRASIFINLIPVFGTLLAIAFLDERLYGYHITGGILVIVGLLLAAGTGGRQQKQPD
ncbi:MAG: DMT family transporter [Xanthomonadales bacterium]|nr:DMT family transporter [Xanthomonadales bacterium]